MKITLVVCVVDTSVPSNKTKRRKQQQQQHVDQLVDLQRETLTAVNSPVAIQGELLEIKWAKLQIQKEMVEMKRAELFAKGMWKDENGNWVCMIKTSTEE